MDPDDDRRDHREQDAWLEASVPPTVQRYLDRVVRSLGAPGLDAVELVFNRWEDVVGSMLASRTRPDSISEGELLLSAEDPAVASHLRWLEPELLERLGDLLGAGRVHSLRVVVRRPGRRGR